MNVSCISSTKDFLELEEKWNALLLKSKARNVFLTHEWVRNWWQIFGSGKILRIFLVMEGSEIFGIAPFYQENARLLGFVSIKQLRFLGDNFVGSDFLDFIFAPQKENEALEAILDYLLENDALWGRLYIQDIREGSGNITAVKEYCIKKDLPYYKSKRFACPFMTLPASFEEFINQPDSTFKKIAYRKNMRKLFKDPAVKYGLISSEEEISPALDNLFALHNYRRDLKGGTGIFMDEKLRLFYHAVSKDLFRKGYLWISYIKVRENVEAIKFSLSFADSFYCLQSGCSKTGLDLRAGTVLTAKLLESLLGRFREFHYLRGSESYKYLWGCKDLLTYRIEVWHGKKWLLVSLILRLTKSLRFLAGKSVRKLGLKK